MDAEFKSMIEKVRTTLESHGVEIAQKLVDGPLKSMFATSCSRVLREEIRVEIEAMGLRAFR